MRMSKIKSLFELPCVSTVYVLRDDAAPVSRGLESTHAPLLADSAALFVKLWNLGHVHRAGLGPEQWGDFSLSAGEISIRVVGNERIQIVCILAPPSKSGTLTSDSGRIETSRKSFSRSVRRALAAEFGVSKLAGIGGGK
jgi:hypothetical protein